MNVIFDRQSFRQVMICNIDEIMSVSLSLGELCTFILNTSRHIQRVVIINKQGRATEMLSRAKYAKQFPDNLSEMLFMQCVLQVSMGRDFDEQCGPINYHISERSNMTMLTLPLDEYVILVLADRNVSPILLARKISSLISDYKMKPIQIKY